jgi:hypothetical protein
MGCLAFKTMVRFIVKEKPYFFEIDLQLKKPYLNPSSTLNRLLAFLLTFKAFDSQ